MSPQYQKAGTVAATASQPLQSGDRLPSRHQEENAAWRMGPAANSRTLVPITVVQLGNSGPIPEMKKPRDSIRTVSTQLRITMVPGWNRAKISSTKQILRLRPAATL